MKKICIRCKIEKFLSEFPERKGSKDGRRNECKDCKSVWDRHYYEENSEKIKQYQKNYTKENSDKIKAYNKKRAKRKSELNRKWFQENSEYRKEYKKKYREQNVEKIKEYTKKYYQENHLKIKQSSKEQRKKKYNNNPLFRLQVTCRNRICKFLNGGRKNKKTREIIGCSWLELKIHLENQFEEKGTFNDEKMCWGNQGKWHVDHRIPLASGKSAEEIYKLCHWTNLQPLWGIDNLKKGKKLY